MKEKKTNLRSFRYSDRVAEILEASEGNTLNEKFENLVLFCFDGVEDAKRDYENYKYFADSERKEWLNLHHQLSVVNDMVKELESMKKRLLDMSSQIGYIEECNTKKSPGFSGRSGADE